MDAFLACFLYGGGGLICLLGMLFLAYTLYVAYVHWKYSGMPSPKMSSFYFGHLKDLLKEQKKFDDDVSFSAAVDSWAEEVNCDTFVVFFLHEPAIFTLDPAVIKALIRRTREEVRWPKKEDDLKYIAKKTTKQSMAVNEEMDVMMDVKNKKTRVMVKNFSKTMGERLMKMGLVSLSSYEVWKPRRQLYDHTFKKNYLKTLLTTFNEMTDTTISEIKPVADGKTVVPLKRYILKLATDIISKVAFGTDFSKIWTSESLEIEVPKEVELEVFNYAVNTVFKAMQVSFNSAFPSLLPLLYPTKVKHYRKCVRGLRKIGRDCIMRRIEMIKKEEEIPQDILTYMLSSKSEDVNMEELVDDFVTFYIAGQETTATAMMFAIILISQHPNVLERLKLEIREVLGNRTAVTEEDMEALQYTERVILESLRLYSPVFGISRELGSPLQIGDSTIPVGVNIFLMGSNMCRRSEYFDDPEIFNPDRFHPDNHKPNPFVYFPFGIGHRHCIGKHFALMEAKIALAKIIQSFTITFPEDYKIEAVVRVTLQPKDDLNCTITANDI